MAEKRKPPAKPVASANATDILAQLLPLLVSLMEENATSKLALSDHVKTLTDNPGKTDKSALEKISEATGHIANTGNAIEKYVGYAQKAYDLSRMILDSLPS